MNEPGINSVAEFVVYYLAAGLVVAALWVILEAHVLLGPVNKAAERRTRQRRFSRPLAALGLVHPVFALTALDINRADDADESTDDSARLRAVREAQVGAVAGCAVAVVVCLVAW